MKYQLFVAFALFAPAAVPAQAQDAGDRPNFTGPTIVAIGGVDGRKVGTSDTEAVYGGSIGYDVGSGAARFGAELEATGASGSECVVTSAQTPNSRLCFRNGRDLSAARGRPVNRKAKTGITAASDDIRPPSASKSMIARRDIPDRVASSS